MNPDKTDAITSMPCPKNVDEIRTYLGMVGFYRRFVPRLGTGGTDVCLFKEECGLGAG